MREEAPEHFYPIEKDSVGAMTAFSTQDTLFVMRTLPPMGILDMGYAASTLDRYPLKVPTCPCPIRTKSLTFTPSMKVSCTNTSNIYL
ncbi:hypothetical protein EON65_00105 [archaeon]|nr:MAG: hypothetical protein EON65_00105 [archaeon]